jgi:hypothetical protein
MKRAHGANASMMSAIAVWSPYSAGSPAIIA